ncbi:hypothetical protein N7470_007461 [Penicillium chermesinum]|nr:hypothetical protein N7470_007461 [Penicillium chermesinum]
MFRLLPWPSAIGGDKPVAADLKRKRSDEESDAPPAVKPRTEDTALPSPSSPTAPLHLPIASDLSDPVASTNPPAQAAGPTVDVNQLRDTITAQLSLEVLLKHNELRLIDQEIAKCQVALEQLRRCAEIPYPGSHVAGISADVSAGTGASVLKPGNGPPPVSPAPWGVTEGPYSRHYARWLLPDPRFDGGEIEPGLAAAAAGMQTEGRSTRGNPMDFSALAGKTRTGRGSVSGKFQALPSGYPPVKEKAGPMIIRRKADNVWVKLVCLDCHRDNFSSTQGFINHCRIAHNRNFASHDAAAQACGVPAETDESGALVGGRTEAAPAVTPTATPTVSTPTVPGYVHPLIRAVPPVSSPASVTPKKDFKMNPPAGPVATPPATVQRIPEPRRQSAPVTANPSFTASPATPHLSALMRERGLGLNMDKLVEEAKTPVDLNGLSDGESDSEEPQLPVSKPGAASQPMRIPTAQAASERTESRKGPERAFAHLQSENATPSRPQSFLRDLSALAAKSQPSHDSLDHSANLSPHTIESNQAPSLVSDDEDDYEAASDSDGPDSSEAGDHEEEFRHIEVQDDERQAPAAPAPEAKPGPSLANPTPQPASTLQQLKQSRQQNIPLMPFDSRDDDPRSFVRPEDPSNPKGTPNGRKPAPSNR